MPFTPPKLDDRSFQQLVDELKKRISLYCPEWTDHNVSDPGITLLELFAYLTEQLLFRLNQVPRLHYMKFAQFLGIPIPTPQPARAVVTFWLAKPWLTAEDPDNAGKEIPAGTEVSTTQTETIAPIVFTTSERVKIWAPRLCALIRQPTGSAPEWIAERQFTESTWKADLFAEPPQRGDAFYFVFDNDLSHHILRLMLDFKKVATNIDENYPPIVWEAYTDQQRWAPLDEKDVKNTTKGLNVPGLIELHLPKLAKYNWQVEHPQVAEINIPRYTIRVQIIRKEYDHSPHVVRIREAATWGRSVETEHIQVVENEYLGESDGSPGQRFPLRYAPIVLPLLADERLSVWPLPEVNDSAAQPKPTKEPTKPKPENWCYVENFSYPSASDDGESAPAMERVAQDAPPHFTIDVTTNEVRLGPAIQLPDGEIKLYGRVPERGRPLYFTRYRYGASIVNVPSKAINVLKSSIPYIKQVENRHPATGGQDAPSLEAMEIAVQRYLRYHRPRRGQAITAEDYATLVLERFPGEVTRVECYSALDAPNTVYVIVIAPIPADIFSVESLTSDDLEVAQPVIAEIERYLYDYRLLTTRIRVENPQWVRIHVRLSLAGKESNEMQEKVREVMTAYLHPLHGGVTGRGWPLGSTLAGAALQSWLKQRLPDIEIRRLLLQQERLQSSLSPAASTPPINPPSQNQWVDVIHDLKLNQMFIPGRYEIIVE